MKKILLSEKDYNKLYNLKLKEILSSQKIFYKRKKCHLKDPRLKNFFEYCTRDYSPVLYTLPFKCYFSFYMYLYLKGIASKFKFDPDQFKLSKPLEINFSEIRRLAGIPIGTVKSAYKELIKFGFLVYTDVLAPDKVNKSKCAMLINDYYVIEHDFENGRTSFNIKLT